MLHSSFLMAHYYSYNVPFSESPRRLWLRDYLTLYCDPWQFWFRLKPFFIFLGYFLCMVRPLRQCPDHFRTLSSLGTHLGPFKHFIRLNFFIYITLILLLLLLLLLHAFNNYICFVYSFLVFFYSLFVYYYHCHYYYYYYLLFFYFFFIHLCNRKLLELFRLQNVQITLDWMVELYNLVSLSFLFFSFFF